jgi:hypothetical protein
MEFKMVEKWLKLFLGKKGFSSLVGMFVGAASGLAVPLAQGKTDSGSLWTGAIIGVIAAITGAAGRGAGTNGN